MNKTVLTIDGMMCGMCEAHVCDAIRGIEKNAKISASHTNGTAEIITDSSPDIARIKAAVNATGYKVTGITSEPYEKKKGLFSLFGRR